MTIDGIQMGSAKHAWVEFRDHFGNLYIVDSALKIFQPVSIQSRTKTPRTLSDLDMIVSNTSDKGEQISRTYRSVMDTHFSDLIGMARLPVRNVSPEDVTRELAPQPSSGGGQ